MDQQLTNHLNSNNTAVIPTDTIYGIVAKAESRQAVENVYTLRKRSPEKPCIILIASLDDLTIFGIDPQPHLPILNSYWPGKVSVILPCADSRFAYLHRGTNSLAFRLPADVWLRELIKNTGPLIAPSANIEGKPNATTIHDAKQQFGDKVGIYVDHGIVLGDPSTIIRIDAYGINVIRKGAVAIQN